MGEAAVGETPRSGPCAGVAMREQVYCTAPSCRLTPEQTRGSIIIPSARPGRPTPTAALSPVASYQKPARTTGARAPDMSSLERMQACKPSGSQPHAGQLGATLPPQCHQRGGTLGAPRGYPWCHQGLPLVPPGATLGSHRGLPLVPHCTLGVTRGSFVPLGALWCCQGLHPAACHQGATPCVPPRASLWATLPATSRRHPALPRLPPCLLTHLLRPDVALAAARMPS